MLPIPLVGGATAQVIFGGLVVNSTPEPTHSVRQPREQDLRISARRVWAKAERLQERLRSAELETEMPEEDLALSRPPVRPRIRQLRR